MQPGSSIPNFFLLFGKPFSKFKFFFIIFRDFPAGIQPITFLITLYTKEISVKLLRILYQISRYFTQINYFFRCTPTPKGTLINISEQYIFYFEKKTFLNINWSFYSAFLPKYSLPKKEYRYLLLYVTLYFVFVLWS